MLILIITYIMNLLDRISLINKGGLILVLALFLFSGCESTDDLGLPLEDENLNILYHEITLPTTAVLVDSVNTTRSRILAGKYQHPDLGMVSSTSFNNFSLPTSGATISENGKFDSLVLSLSNSYRYGSGNLNNQIFAHLLQDTIGLTRKYSQDAIPYDMNPVSSLNFTVEDTVNRTLRFIRFPDAMGADLFEKVQSKADEVSTNEKFQQYFKGIALTGSEANEFVLGFNALETLLSLYYHIDGDTTLYRYSFGLDSAIQFNRIVSDRSGTPLASLTEPYQSYDPGTDKFYLQAGTGITPKISFKPFKDFINNIGEEVVINRAEFSIGLDLPGKFTPSPTALQLFPVDEKNKRTVLSSSSFSGITYFYAAINSEVAQSNLVLQPDTVSNQLVYNGIITNYSENMLAGSVSEDILIFADQFSPGEATSSVNQLVTDGDRVKLKIYYTTQKKQ